VSPASAGNSRGGSFNFMPEKPRATNPGLPKASERWRLPFGNRTSKNLGRGREFADSIFQCSARYPPGDRWKITGELHPQLGNETNPNRRRSAGPRFRADKIGLLFRRDGLPRDYSAATEVSAASRWLRDVSLSPVGTGEELVGESPRNESWP
jgi:hypothetical protein